MKDILKEIRELELKTYNDVEKTAEKINRERREKLLQNYKILEESFGLRLKKMACA